MIVVENEQAISRQAAQTRDCEPIPGYLYCFLATSESWGLTLAESTGLALGLSTEPKYLTEIGEKKVWSKKNYSQSNINIIYCGLQLNN